MNATQLFAAFLAEGISAEKCGIVSGDNIISAGPYRMFGANAAGTEIKCTCSYLYYYGAADDLFCFLPEEHIIWPSAHDESYIHLWEIKN